MKRERWTQAHHMHAALLGDVVCSDFSFLSLPMPSLHSGKRNGRACRADCGHQADISQGFGGTRRTVLFNNGSDACMRRQAHSEGHENPRQVQRQDSNQPTRLVHVDDLPGSAFETLHSIGQNSTAPSSSCVTPRQTDFGCTDREAAAAGCEQQAHLGEGVGKSQDVCSIQEASPVQHIL